jgi:peptidyl-prolyl cis-trans isomerase C
MAMVSIDPTVATPRKRLQPRIVSVNGVAIPREAIAQEIQNHPAPTQLEAWTAAASALAIRELLLQEARRLELQAEPIADGAGRRETMEEALVRTLVEEEVVTPTAGEGECRRYYGQNKRRFRSPDLFEVSHILIAATPGTAEGRAAARRQAEAVIGTLGSAPDEFGTLCRQLSSCPSREVDGNLGQIGPGQTVPEFEAALGAMPIGSVHAVPVESRYGFHIVRVNRRKEGRQLPFEAVRQRIGDYLDERVRRTAIRHYIAMLAGRSVIDGVDLAGSPSPLVQ